MIEFAYPWMFLLLILPIFIIFFAPAYKEKKSSVRVPYFARLVDITGEKPQSGAVVLNRNLIQRIVLGLAWLALVSALAKPEIIGPPIEQKKSARDLMVAVDLSGSMSVADFTSASGDNIDRLQAVKMVLGDFAKGRTSDRLGLILFGDAPYLQAPFTADIDAWLKLLNESAIGMAGQSTAFGDAIGLAISVFERSKTKNRVLVILTDGNDTNSKVPPIDAAKVAAAYDIKIYCIAMGDPQSLGEESIDLKVLETVAQVTGGTAFTALDSQQLQGVYQKIDALEPEIYDSFSYRTRTSIHYYPVIFFAMMYVILLFFVGVRIKLLRRKYQARSATNA